MDYKRIMNLALMVVTSCLRAVAGIAGGYSPAPPTSYILPTRDGKHLLVIFDPRAQNHYRTLPNEEEIDVRPPFSASGLYPIGSRTPIWTVAWAIGDWHFQASDDGRY